ncbi:unnamed protein product, partial [Rotaria sp. Silwood1]
LSTQSGDPESSLKNSFGIHCPLWHRYSLSLHSLISNCQQCSSSDPPSIQSTYPLQMSLQSKHAEKEPRLHFKYV